MLKTYMDKYEALRKGSIYIRTKGSGQYCYLNYRDCSRIVSEYIGSPDSPEVQDIKEQIEERKRVKQIIKDMKLEQKEIDRVLKWLLIIWFLEKWGQNTAGETKEMDQAPCNWMTNVL